MIAIVIFVAGVARQAVAHDCVPGFFGFQTNRCGSYGCVNGRPAVVIPGYPNGGPYPTPIIIINK